MRDEDFYNNLSDIDSEEIERYLRDLARLNKIREEEKLKEENKKLRKTINENNKKLEEMGQNIRKVQKKADKINIIGGDRSSKAKSSRNVKSDVKEDVETNGIKIPLPNSHQKKIIRKNDTLIVQETQNRESVKKVVKKKVSKPVNKKVVKTKKNLKKVDPKVAKKVEKEVKVKKTKKKRSFLTRLILLILLFTIVGGGTYFAFHYVKNQKGYYTVAVFGVDSRDGNVEEGALSDVNMIINVNRETGDIQLISIYRDMYSMIDEDGKFHKFNQAYVEGGHEQALEALNRNLDLDIKNYITVNWKAVIDAINILGGVDLEVTDAEFKYLNSFISYTVEATGVGSHELEHAGMNHLDGVQAVAYARLRLMDTDFNRTERQRKVVSLAFDKAKNANFSTLYSILVAVLPQTSTNVKIEDLIPFAKDISKYHLSETAGFPFDKDTKKMHKRDYVIPITLKSNVIALHQMLFGNIPGYTYTPSEMLNKISNKIIKDTGLGANKEDTDINVDTDLDSAIGITPHKSDSDETHEKVETEHVEDNQVEESHENPVQEDGINEETIDENTTEAEIDAESEISSE
ncbi:LCP family protein [Lachnoanaerobaculum umeaense]|uniref:LytR family transcriptional regulator n=1 Tax=Lachnoanaerobaculum umeaense TaxID=617123 RepID=A0A385Q0Y2_9FIRM|nr:LCP family protein [Lachnoanaerobaculum umeaense]AYA99419.1 LytR family transcriptional regulator [Lachnoanaerobaculum umeaense]PZW99519.1 LytR family transcriptional attenuator [Lachnoanaerobaculum umeaense]